MRSRNWEYEIGGDEDAMRVVVRQRIQSREIEVEFELGGDVDASFDVRLPSEKARQLASTLLDAVARVQDSPELQAERQYARDLKAATATESALT